MNDQRTYWDEKIRNITRKTDTKFPQRRDWDDSFFNTTIYVMNNKENIRIENFSFTADCPVKHIIRDERSCNVHIKDIQISNIVCEDGSALDANQADSVLYENIVFKNIESNCISCIYHDRINAELKNCIFENNYSHGGFSYTNLYLISHEYGKIENCIMQNNGNNNNEIVLVTLSYWDFCEPNFKINNCIVTDNYSPSFGIVSCGTTTENGYISFSNNTFSNNSAEVATLVMVGNIDFSNNIMWDDTPYEIFLWDVSDYGIISTLNLQYNDIRNGVDGVWNQNNANIVNWLEGNINEDPQFTGTGDFPYYLSSTSPCIDAGTPDTTGLHLPWLDVAGNPRVYGGRIDMGALEWQGYGVDPDTGMVNNLYFFKNTPNPFRDQTTISFTSLDYDRVREYTLSIYNSRGQLVRRFYGPDEHFWAINEIVWDGRDMDGNITAPGVYFYSLEFEGTAVVRKMVKLR